MTIWLAETSVRGTVVFRVGRSGEDLVAEWPGVARLVVDRDGVAPNLQPEDSADPSVVEKVRLGPARALVRHLHGEVTLHASAVAGPAGALAFVGDSGVGKSTIAFALSSDPNRAEALLADDLLYVSGTQAMPTESTSWLDEGQTMKTIRRPTRIAASSTSLRAVVQLEFGPAVELVPKHGVEAAAILMRSLVRFVLDEPSVHRADLERLSHLVDRVPVYTLRRPKGVEHEGRTLDMLSSVGLQ